ncbi:PLP-dependent aminotransferase family protein [Kitasatospora sp. NBC_01287]|uniref:MocR-like pyridoxine biosynthesis transcription factor PdxR n=1 Tax=Kitasatospora sp. NBC_01287 TaxID=2903573 RepID=UPI00224D1724|nr:PLP-dependent aminotransferase family protein [Kitasatospora sp. NBC_01287]MCX4744533.1 PLP-dependent aminotransferase family protein [Kitasatospora sp. NBC_01287]
MTESWVNSAQRIGRDLHLDLTGPGSRRAVLIRALREAVRDGRLAPGTRLPPYRSLAADLGLARNTVADAYAELVAEGWLTARQGSGTHVAERTRPRRTSPPTAPAAPPTTPHGQAAAPPEQPEQPEQPRHNLRQGQPDPASFPRGAWLAAARRALTAAPTEAFGPGDPRGRAELRRALADYLARVRGVRTDPERIVVCSGVAHALRLLFGGQVLRGRLAVEGYGLPFHRALLERAGVRTDPLTVDEHGARTTELARLPRPRAVLLTPAHQFPTGAALGPERRAAAIDWARGSEGLILEDDYDGEFRHDRQPVGALQGLDPDRVVYLGSVSKSLSPAVRLGWLVLPERLVGPVLAAKGEREAWASVLDQLTLAELIESGAYDRHIRRMRLRYRRRRDQLVTALAERTPHLAPTGIAAGLHAVLRLPPGTEAAAYWAAAAQGIALDGLSTFRHPEATGTGPAGLVIGYATPSEHAYPAALAALCGVLRVTVPAPLRGPAAAPDGATRRQSSEHPR